jgi:hypothetical protein
MQQDAGDFCNTIGQKQTHTPQQQALLFDHLVGAGEQPWRHLNVERSRRLKVDDELELAALSGYGQAKGTTSAVIARIVIGYHQDAGPE